ncbi:CRISPR-associated endonuclease Cas1 [Dietzia sp. SYD-A1]|uniref:CRISPR-associated endonuclease Cas1 n=1 Tax=Dietzia sp. SYD-A1 TaxID=2780141 RepID=UPI0035C7F2F2
MSAQLKDGTWTPGPLRRVDIPKASGGLRHLEIPSLLDRVAERAILSVLSPLVDPDLQPDSYGGRPGLGVDNAISAVSEQVDDGAEWVVRTDLADCFASIPHSGVLECLRPYLDDPELDAIMTHLLERGGDGRADRGLPQGSPLSPLLANLYLDRLDRTLWDHGVHIVRYLDDICATAPSREEACRILEVLDAEARVRGLTLSRDKTAVQHISDGTVFLGRPLGGQAHAPRTALPRRATIYLLEPATALRAKGPAFLLCRAGKQRQRHPARRVRTIVCGPRVLITTAALALAKTHGVDVVVTDPRHGVTAHLGCGTLSGPLVVAQYRQSDDPERRIELARAMVRGKISNCRVLLTRTKSRRTAVHPATVRRLHTLYCAVDRAHTVAQLMGVEGAASRTYFDGVRSLISHEWQFARRNRRPPRDPVNAMLSYGYTILSSEVSRAIGVASLDPDQGFLHARRSGRPSLVCDLMEEFRPLIVDTTVLRLLRGKELDPRGFASTADGCRVDVSTRRLLITALEERLLTTLLHPVTRVTVSYRQALDTQASLLAEAILQSGPYQPMGWR